MSDDGIDLEESELLTLSKDCKFVRKKTNKGLFKLDPSQIIILVETNFSQNDFLVALLSRTDCFDGYTSEQIISIFGDAKKRPSREDSSRFLLEYHFIINKKKVDIMKIEFKDDKLESINIRRTELSIIIDYY